VGSPFSTNLSARQKQKYVGCLHAVGELTRNCQSRSQHFHCSPMTVGESAAAGKNYGALERKGQGLVEERKSRLSLVLLGLLLLLLLLLLELRLVMSRVLKRRGAEMNSFFLVLVHPHASTSATTTTCTAAGSTNAAVTAE
jgi:hypothetical protein